MSGRISARFCLGRVWNYQTSFKDDGGAPMGPGRSSPSPSERPFGSPLEAGPRFFLFLSTCAFRATRLFQRARQHRHMICISARMYASTSRSAAAKPRWTLERGVLSHAG
jgi:hypothetical protein